MRFSWIVIGLLLIHTIAAEDEENLTNVFVKYVTAEELGLDGLSPEKLVVSKLGDPVKAYSFSTVDDIQKAMDGLKEEALKQRFSLMKEDVTGKNWVSLPISQLVEIYEIGTIYANINKKTYRSRVKLTVTSPDNYKSVKIVQVYPYGEDISATDFIFNQEDKPVTFKTRDPVLEWNIPLVSPGQVIKMEYVVKDILTNANVLVLALGEPYSSAEPLPEVEEVPVDVNASQNESAIVQNETEVKPQTETTFSMAFLLTALSIIALVAIVVAIFHYELKEKAVAEKKKFSENLDKYVSTSLQMGADPKTLRQALLTAGWDQHKVDKLIEHHMKR